MRPRFTKPLLAHTEAKDVLRVVDEGKRENVDLSRIDPLQGTLTDVVTLGSFGTTHRIAHKLGRTPKGFELAWQMGFEPKYRVLDVDSRHITLVSLDQVDVCGWFIVSVAGAVTTTSSAYLAVPSQQGVGHYRVTLQFDCSALLTADCNSTLGMSGNYDFRELSSSFAGPIYVDFQRYNGVAAVAFTTATAFYMISVTGTAPKARWWVY